MKKVQFILLFILIGVFTNAQENIDALESENIIIQNEFDINPLDPARATFYSAVLPGLGQYYNKKYWMIPVIYGAMGTSIFFYKRNDIRYNQFLEAYKLDLVGKPHEFSNLDKSGLERGIDGYKKQRDLSLFITIGFYVLNILEANVDAHLPNDPIDTNISYKPVIITNPVDSSLSYGAMVSYRF